MTTRIFVPNDTSACSLGADAVAAAIEVAIERGALDASIVRNGSRGAYALEPLVEIDSPAGRIGFPRVAPRAVPALFAGEIPNARHPLCIGRVDDVPFLKNQLRLTFARAGLIDPLITSKLPLVQYSVKIHS